MFGKITRIIANRLEAKVRKWCNIEHLEKRLNTLEYIVHHGVDISSFPQAKGVLRGVQEADTQLLRIVHEICEKHHLRYWLDWGTLLGAVRHKGFIPWDDDIDIAMPLEDYNKAVAILSSELNGYGDIKIYEKTHLNNVKMIHVNHGRYGLNLDIFPKESTQETRDIFPLVKIAFEGYSFYAPNNPDLYLKNKYGNYMEFPRIIDMHSKNGKPIYQNAMDDLSGLEAIKSSLQRIKF